MLHTCILCAGFKIGTQLVVLLVYCYIHSAADAKNRDFSSGYDI